MISSEFELACLTVDERLSEDYGLVPATASQLAAANKKVREWCEIAAEGNHEKFVRRLAVEGITLDEAVCRIAAVDRLPSVAEPRWVRGGFQALKNLKEDCATRIPERFPFENLLNGFVVSAIDDLAESVDEDLGVYLTDGAINDLSSQLLRRTTDLLALPIYTYFIRWKSSRGSSYHEFELFMQSEGFDSLFQYSPVVFRLLSEIKDQWLSSNSTFIRNFIDDCASGQIQTTFGIDDITLAGLDSNLSDPHNSGKVVLLLKFKAGGRILYKPRDLKTDVAVKEFLSLFSALGLENSFYVPKVLTRKDYGWVEFVNSNECQSEADVENFFNNSGKWLAILYLLGASDMHMENIKASGRFPVPLDFETILQGLSTKPVGLKPSREALWAVSAYLEETVLTVGMLPGRVRTAEGRTISVGGLEESIVKTKYLDWSGLGTKNLELKLGSRETRVDSNLPIFDGKPVPLGSYKKNLIAGFKDVMEIALRNKDRIGTFFEDDHIKTLRVRRVLRPTRFYYLLMSRLTNPRKFCDGITWSMQAEFISRLFEWDGEQAEPWKICLPERKALTKLNIPSFYVSANKTISYDDEGVVTNLFMRTGIEVSRDRLNKLSAASIADQCEIIDVSIGHMGLPECRVTSSTGPDRVDEKNFGDQDLPTLVFKSLQETSIQTQNSVAWLSLEYLDHNASAQLVPMGHDLYSGNAGIALFFAAYGRHKSDPWGKELSVNTMNYLSDALLEETSKMIVRSMGTGGLVGVGSLVYAFASCYEILGDTRFLESATQASHLLDEKSLCDDRHFDLASGSAGACLGLIKLYELTAERQFLDRAKLCAEILLGARQNHGMWANAIFEHQPMTGISHGASGFALTFSRLWRHTRVDRYRRIAQDCICFEDVYFDKIRGNWPDLRNAKKPFWPIQWCYGASGIGLARLNILDDLDVGSDDQRAVINRAIDTTIDYTDHRDFSVCCGEAGRILFLFEAGVKLKRIDLIKLARKRLEDIRKCWLTTGTCNWSIGNDRYNLGMFRGLAGVGYTALKMECQDLPNVALLS